MLCFSGQLPFISVSRSMTGPGVRYLFLLFLAIPLFMHCAQCFSHDARPVYVHINAQDNTVDKNKVVYRVQWKVPASLPLVAHPAPDLPGFCESVAEVIGRSTGDAYVYRNVIRCASSLAQNAVAIRYPSGNPGLSTLIRVQLESGEQYSQILKPGQSEWRIPASEKKLTVAYQYIQLGIEHILAGVDHLLFVACLLFIANSPRRIVLAITGFTLAHSLTLVLASLNLVRLPIAAVEAAIALSIVFLAHEIVVNHRSSWTWRYPLLVSSLFGLLHGFGFASVLRDIGLPQRELVTGLFAFNVGVEVGQLLFIGVLLVLLALTGKILRVQRSFLLSHPAVIFSCAYTVGIIASYWFLQRLTVIFA